MSDFSWMNDETVWKRFWPKVKKEGECWVWKGAIKLNGYGSFKVKTGFTMQAHRISFYFHKGRIPPNLHLDHLCRNRSCVNPDHLEPVTQAENNRRGRGINSIHAAKTHCKHGHLLSGDNVRIGRTYTGLPTRICKACRRMHYRNERARQAVKPDGPELAESRS